MSDNLLTDDEIRGVAEIRRLLDEAYKHYFDLSDGYCKSSEGSVTLDFGTYFDRRDEPELRLKGITIFSYVLGPSRFHDFGTVREALETVQQWHAEEMARTYEEDRFIPVEKILSGGGDE